MYELYRYREGLCVGNTNVPIEYPDVLPRQPIQPKQWSTLLVHDIQTDTVDMLNTNNTS